MKNYNKDIYGPGDDNYGRNIPFWKKYIKEDTKMCKKCGEVLIFISDINFSKFG
jgi:hypothetical protein